MDQQMTVLICRLVNYTEKCCLIKAMDLHHLLLYATAQVAHTFKV